MVHHPRGPYYMSRSAIDALRTLPFRDGAAILRVLRALTRGERPVASKKLGGWGGAWRTRAGDHRVVWRPNDEGGVDVLRVELRKDVYRTTTDGANVVRIESSVADSEPEPGEPDPGDSAYRLPSLDSFEFAHFLADTYRYAPRLTADQRQLAAHLDALCDPRTSADVACVQCGPGSGKTVVAGVLAAELSQREAPDTFVLLLAPAPVIEEMRLLDRVVAAESAVTNGRLVFVSFRDWLEAAFRRLDRGLGLATDEEERAALAECGRAGDPVGPRDVDLYRSFVLQKPNERDAAWLLRRERVQRLASRAPERFRSALERRGRVSHVDAACAVAIDPPPPPGAARAIVLVDEAQDGSRVVISALRAMQRAWTAHGVPTGLCLLGDLNQRITPSGFYWDDLPASLGVRPVRVEGWTRNHRNTPSIAAFAHSVRQEAADLARSLGARHLPGHTHDDSAGDMRDDVALLPVRDAAHAASVVALLEGGPLGTGFLRDEMLQSCWVLWPGPPPPGLRRPGLVVKDGAAAKGLECDACTVFLQIPDDADLEAINVSFTMVTRARRRMLVLADPGTTRRLAARAAPFREVDEVEARRWIGSSFARFDPATDPDESVRRLHGGTKDRTPHLDGYEILERLGGDVSGWEQVVLELAAPAAAALGRARAIVSDPDTPLRPIDRVRLTVLLSRIAGDPERAAVEAGALVDLGEVGVVEAARLRRACATDLTQRGRRLAAARLLAVHRLPGGEPPLLLAGVGPSDAVVVARWLTRTLTRIGPGGPCDAP